jgi:hypothetical protein
MTACSAIQVTVNAMHRGTNNIKKKYWTLAVNLLAKSMLAAHLDRLKEIIIIKYCNIYDGG